MITSRTRTPEIVLTLNNQPAVQAAKDLVLVAVFSRTLKSAKAIADTVPDVLALYSEDSDKGYDELLKRSDIDAIIMS